MRHRLPARRTAAFALAAAILTPALLTACTPTDRFSAGRPLSREELDSIAESIREATAIWNPDADYPEGTVFWPSGGSAYHTNPGCKHLQRAAKVYCGTVDEALAAGKATVCIASCLQAGNETETD